MRANLKKARLDNNLTQQQVATALGITVNAYQKLEYGKRIGKIESWDKLEDLLQVNQRVLREISPD